MALKKSGAVLGDCGPSRRMGRSGICLFRDSSVVCLWSFDYLLSCVESSCVDGKFFCCCPFANTTQHPIDQGKGFHACPACYPSIDCHGVFSVRTSCWFHSDSSAHHGFGIGRKACRFHHEKAPRHV